MRLRVLAVLLIIAPVTGGLAACGANGPAATSLASKIGCANVTDAPQNSPAQQDIDCDLPDGTTVEIATFGSSSDQQNWMLNQPSATCCAEGNLWAATVTPSGSEPVGPILQQIAHNLDGRQVSKPS